jgi:peroxiredoxin
MLALLVVVLAGVSAWGLSRISTRPGPHQVVGDRLEDFRLKATDGSTISRMDFEHKKALVLVFTGIDCPVSNLYMPRLATLAQRYSKQGVAFLGVNSNAHESALDVEEHARQHHLGFPVAKDGENRLADRLRIERTCEAVVLDAQGYVRYHGAIDDQYARGAIRDAPKRAYLAEAIDSVLNGRKVAEPLTSVVACPIERISPKKPARPRLASLPKVEGRRRRPSPEPADIGDVTYAEDVAPIIQQKCRYCHRPGEVAPFSLRDYDDAKRWAQSIYEVVDQGLMPPWYADPRYGSFSNDRSLSDRERSVLMAWVDQEMPPGDLGKVPLPEPSPQGWTIGEPDLILEMPEPFDVPAEGILDIMRFYVPTNFQEDVWVQAAQAMPGDRAVVHHICVFIMDPERPLDESASLDEQRDAQPELVCYAPGDMPEVFPPGVAKKIPAGAVLEIQVHYTPIGVPRFDRSSVGLKLARGPVRSLAMTRGASNRNFVLPAGDPNIEVKASYTIKQDGRLLSLTPHMHYRGKDFRYEAVFPDGRRQTLLFVPSYDFNWQSVYRLSEPLPMPRGTRIECVAHFDNSADNPLNPDPTRDVRWGEQSYDEMMIGYLDFCVDLPKPRMAGKEQGHSTR